MKPENSDIWFIVMHRLGRPAECTARRKPPLLGRQGQCVERGESGRMWSSAPHQKASKSWVRRRKASVPAFMTVTLTGLAFVWNDDAPHTEASWVAQLLKRLIVLAIGGCQLYLVP